MDQIEEEYRKLCVEEEEVTGKLKGLLAGQCRIEAELRAVTPLFPRLQSLKGDSERLREMIAFTAGLAEGVSAKVRELDASKGRVLECQRRVNDLLDLQMCREGVAAAMEAEDFERAAGHVHRFLAIDESTLKMGTAGDAAQGPTVSSSLSLLHEARDRLCRTVTRRFDDAVQVGDAASVERFFKILPLIDLHDEGLQRFGRYLAAQVGDAAQKALHRALHTESADAKKRSAVLFADTLTLLLEGVARVIETYQPLVETYYGPGRLIQVVQHLQVECDSQAAKILAEFRRARQLERQVRLVAECGAVSKATTPAATVGERLDPRDLNALLNELTLLSQRTELYLRFLGRRTRADLEALDGPASATEAQRRRLDALLAAPNGISRSVQELLGHYVALENYFLRESVQKAAALDAPADDAGLTGSVVDEVFFLVKMSVGRSLDSASVDTVCAVINNACTLLEQDYAQVFQQQLRQGFPSGYLDLAFIQSSLQQGRIQSDTEKAKANFLVALNNVEASVDNVTKLEATLAKEIDKRLGAGSAATTARDRDKLASCLAGLGGSVAGKLRELSVFGHDQLTASAIKPRVKPWVDDFRLVNHDIDDEELAGYEAQDPFVQQLVGHLDGFLAGFRAALLPRNYETLVETLTTQVAVQLEKVILKTRFSRLGAVQLDKELRVLVGYLSATSAWTIRDRFTRLTQMATLLNLDKLAEIHDYWGPSNAASITWRLTTAQVRQVLALRTDFRSEEVKRLKL